MNIATPFFYSLSMRSETHNSSPNAQEQEQT